MNGSKRNLYNIRKSTNVRMSKRTFYIRCYTWLVIQKIYHTNRIRYRIIFIFVIRRCRTKIHYTHTHTLFYWDNSSSFIFWHNMLRMLWFHNLVYTMDINYSFRTIVLYIDDEKYVCHVR